MKMIRFLSLFFMSVFVLSLASAETCNHPLIESGSHYTLVETITRECHTYTYYTYFYCETCGHEQYLPANNPLFPDDTRPHDFSQRNDLGLTGLTSHTYRWTCSVSSNCTYDKLETHNSVTVTDLGHATSDIHVYMYTCLEPGCSFERTGRKVCHDNCPVHIYKRKPPVEEQ